MKKILGREPAVFWSLVAAVLLALLQLVPMPTEVNGALNGLVLAGAGVATAVMVAADKALPALVGLVQAVFAVFLAFGTPVPETTQTGILALLASVAGFFVRSQVLVKLDGDGADRFQAAYTNGYQAGQDDQAVALTRPTETGTHGHTEVIPITGEVGDDQR
jgi:hypothetical protein